MAGPSHLSGAFWALRGRLKRCPPEVPEVAKARAGEGGADGIQVMKRKMRHVGPRPLARHKPLPGVFYTTPSREPNTDDHYKNNPFKDFNWWTYPAATLACPPPRSPHGASPGRRMDQDGKGFKEGKAHAAKVDVPLDTIRLH